jgi:hypothetical protein
MLSWILPMIMALLLPSPLGKKIPTNIAGILAKLTPASIDEIVDHLKDRASRRDTAVDLVIRVAGRHSITLTESEAGKVVDALLILYKDVIGLARRLI